ncbi:MAG: NAD+ synthase [Spirochaetota bacterium]
MRIAVAQLNPTVGDVQGNLEKLGEVWSRHRGRVDLVVFPEMFLIGYPPKDLLEYRWMLDRVGQALDRVRELSREDASTGILVGAPLGNGDKRPFNAAVLVQDGEITARRFKTLLPTYDVFDETRYFEPGARVEPVPFKGERLGITVCEDAWNDPALWPGFRMYTFDPVQELARRGATLLVNISASPFSIGKEELRYRLLSGHAARHGMPFLYVNQVGGNDELLFDGRSLLVDRQGNPVEVFSTFQEEVRVVDTTREGEGPYQPQERIESVYQALVMGLGDYLAKCGFREAIVGLSGGIDSAVTAALACASAGPENVLGLIMPSRYTSPASLEDAGRLAANLGMRTRTISIDRIYQEYLDTLAPHFQDLETDKTEENIQARIRGNLLMAFSNKFGHLVLSTGNKSELAVGYCTLYGDMSGGLAVISDVPKTMVYDLARFINRSGERIPAAILRKAPSAELKQGQTDQDTLPPYQVLDDILAAFIEEGRSWEEIVARGHDRDTVKWVIRTVIRNEYKRKQAAPGLKVTSKAFGVGRRMPVAARYSL